MPDGRPNIIMLICDGMRLDALGAMGRTPCRTPTWDRMASEGALLAEHRTTGPMCSPARASILTGLQPHQAGMPCISYAYTQDEGAGAAQEWPGISVAPFSQFLRDSGYEAFLGVAKTLWMDLHTYVSLVFAVVLLVHLALNLRLFSSMTRHVLRGRR